MEAMVASYFVFSTIYFPSMETKRKYLFMLYSSIHIFYMILDYILLLVVHLLLVFLNMETILPDCQRQLAHCNHVGDLVLNLHRKMKNIFYNR